MPLNCSGLNFECPGSPLRGNRRDRTRLRVRIGEVRGTGKGDAANPVPRIAGRARGEAQHKCDVKTAARAGRRRPGCSPWRRWRRWRRYRARDDRDPCPAWAHGMDRRAPRLRARPKRHRDGYGRTTSRAAAPARTAPATTVFLPLISATSSRDAPHRHPAPAQTAAHQML